MSALQSRKHPEPAYGRRQADAGQKAKRSTATRRKAARQSKSNDLDQARGVVEAELLYIAADLNQLARLAASDDCERLKGLSHLVRDAAESG